MAQIGFIVFLKLQAWSKLGEKYFGTGRDSNMFIIDLIAE
jgi:hypothetical protein